LLCRYRTLKISKTKKYTNFKAKGYEFSFYRIITALHGMQAYSHEKLSKRVDYDKTKESSAQIFIPYERR